MKRNLLFAATILTGCAFGQFTQTNEPAVGALVDYFLCDSNVTNYDGTTGSGVTWDYSNIAGVIGVQKLTTVIDASTSADYADFPGSTKATSIETAITTYFTSDATSRTSQGFVYNEPTFGTVKAKWSGNQQITHAYPMALGDNLTDDFSGNLSFTFNMVAQNPSCTGTSYAWVDGQGTLQLAGNTYNNVLRYKLIDTAFTSVILFGDLEVIRTQYEYYDLASSTLPLFTHTSIKIQAPGASQPLTEQTLVLSKDEPQEWLAIEEMNDLNVILYPNPATDKLTLSGISGPVEVELLDQTGRIVRTAGTLNSGSQISLEGIEAGIYTVKVTDNSSTVLKQIIKR